MAKENVKERIYAQWPGYVGCESTSIAKPETNMFSEVYFKITLPISLI